MASAVYVSCAEDGEVRLYALRGDGSLEPRAAYKAEKTLGPLAVSPDERWLVGAARSVFTGRSVFRSGLDMFVVGLGVAVVGYYVGDWVGTLL